MQSLQKVFVLLGMLLVLFGCGSRYNPQTGLYSVYGSSKFALPQGYEKIGGLGVSVLPKTAETGAYPYQTFNTTVFGDGEAYILSQTMQLTNERYYIRPLGGMGVSKWGSSWRMNMYQLDPNNTSVEYRRYMDYIKGTGHPVASGYKMEMYDRLIGRKLIARVLVLTPDAVSGNPAAPPAKELYTLERDDFRSR
ncbi:hypothetical protein [Halodesulfovibrio marinisediminis]|uniref:Uncharacterized protein n=1 Tax=Halodesulfovibrio marinisediminis DSM 17456 TaxID=1121457 RepID=A0A1N6FHL4_9BACT|nr:hypothetical protein [Halodesulfovibrio marinisediminis]SIN94771.1 hypothetical protein SAMN02745161_1319 [Halodesulfovibrio marinisediminis DSM 17456]